MGVFTGFVREASLADDLGLTVSALRAWRRRGYGPVAHKIGKAVVYKADEVQLFMASLPVAEVK